MLLDIVVRASIPPEVRTRGTMPIVFVHGVAAREEDRRHAGRWRRIEGYLRRYVAPAIAPDPAEVAIHDAHWGDMGAGLAWGGASLPPTARAAWPDHPIAHLAPHGPAGDLWRDLGRRGLSAPGHLLARAAAVARRPLTAEMAIFLGDALLYFARRGTPEEPGAIPRRVLEVLLRARADQRARPDEPLVVLSHSLGGQIIYDLVTAFLPRAAGVEPLHIDFWAAASSQVGLFEEMKLCLASSPRYGAGRPVPFPDRRYLGAWWNTWDPHDFLSFTVAGIIEGVDDSLYDSGLSLTGAHFGCLEQPSFYSLLGRKLRATLHARAALAP
jgi:hypothetical protein